MSSAISGITKGVSGLFKGVGGILGGEPSAPAAPTVPLAETQAPMTAAEVALRKQPLGQRAAGAGYTRSASDIDRLGFTAPTSRREASRQLLG